MKKAAAILILTMSVGCAFEEAQPRATSGDERVQPAWQEQLTIRVGQGEGDIRGDSDKAIQAAVDYVARLGGGTVEILPGTYRFRNSVFLASKVRLTGHGAKTVLLKEPSLRSLLSQDSDWYDQEITLANPEGFRLGDGVCLRSGSQRFAIKRTLTARQGSRFLLDRPLRDNVWLSAGKEAVVETLFPILSGENIKNAVIENLTLDGNLANNGLLDGNYSGCVWLQDCRQITLRGLEARNQNGDGLSWQVSHDVVVENCYSHGHSGLGLHPGSGSQRSVIRQCRLEENDIGIFFCWGVRGALAEENTMGKNRVGISIGHRDSNNIIRKNTITGSRETGILFRPEKDAGAAGHRNLIEKNTLTDNGGEAGAAIKLAAPVEGVTILGNTITETRSPARRTGIEIGQGVGKLTMEGNTISGFLKDVTRADP